MIDKDAEIRRLNILVRELREELDEWKAQAGERRRADDDAAEVGRVMRRLAVSRQRALLLLHMIRHAGTPQTHAVMRDVLVVDDETDGFKLAGGAVCVLRKRLKRLTSASIETVWGVGYVIGRPAADVLRDLLAIPE